MEKIIVITGPQGSGKTTVAKETAKKYAASEFIFAEDLIHALNGRKKLTPAEIYIIDGISVDDILKIKELVLPTSIPGSILILTTNAPLDKEMLNPMFSVIDLK